VGFFDQWVVDLARGALQKRPATPAQAAPSPAGYLPGLKASPLFDDFAEKELVALMRELRLLSFDPGDIIVTEEEPGESIFLLARGTAKVFVRDTGSRNSLCAPSKRGRSSARSRRSSASAAPPP
jgi:hypothetical protein